MKNKFISALVSIGMVFGLTPVVAFADDTTDDSQTSEPIVQIVDDNNDNPTDEVPNAIVGDSTTDAQGTPGDETIVETDDESSDVEDEFYTGEPNAPPIEEEDVPTATDVEYVGTMFETGKIYLAESYSSKAPLASAGDFTFTVTADGSNPEGDPIQGSMTFTNGANGSINFWSGLQWIKNSGTYKYTLSCTAVNIEGYELPTEEYSFTVYTDNITSFGAYAESGRIPDTGYKNVSLYFFAAPTPEPELELGTVYIYKDVVNFARPQVPVYSLDKPVAISGDITTYGNQLPDISFLYQTEFTFHFTADIPEEWEGTEIPDSGGAVWQDIDETFTLTHMYDSNKSGPQRWKSYTLPVGTTFTVEEVTDDMNSYFAFNGSRLDTYPSSLKDSSNISGEGTTKITGTITGEGTYYAYFYNQLDVGVGYLIIGKIVEQGDKPTPPSPPVYSLSPQNDEEIDYNNTEFHFHITATIPDKYKGLFDDIDEDFTLTHAFRAGSYSAVSMETYYLPVGTTFTITEKQDVPNFTFVGGQYAYGSMYNESQEPTYGEFDTPVYTGEITENGMMIQVIYNNTYREQTFGSLQIKKNVETNSPAYYDRLNKANDVFTFEVTIGDNPTETITLKAGETSKLFENIPTGTAYTIKEINLPDGYSVEDATITGTIQGEETETVEFNNTWTYSPSDLYLTIGKVVDIPAGWQAWYDKSTGGTDTFTIVVNIAGVETEYTLTNGQIIQIPVKEGSIYTVYEKDVEDPYSFVKISVNGVDTTQEKVQGRITGDTKVIVTNTWTFDIGDQWIEFPTVTPEPEYSSLTLTKTVLASNNVLYNHFADANTEFTFEVTINGKTQVVKLKNNESWSIDNLPIGTTYKIEEVDIPDGYTALANPIMGTIMKENKDVSVKFVNKWDMPIKPGPFPEFGVIPDPEPDPEPGPKPDPVDPVDPVDPTEPTDPVEPTDPTEPETPTQPEEPECWIPQGSQTSPQTGYDYIDTPWGKLPKTGDNETILLVSTFSLIGAAAIALLLIGRCKMKKD